jgi:protein-L-isoaspartate(D-aspartate) O-methyltransferase
MAASAMMGGMFASEMNRELVAALRERGIADGRVLGAIGAVPRDVFVEEASLDSAYADKALPIACGQTISQPYVVAYMTEKLGLMPDHEVLEIGTGSGYQAAILANICRHVFTIERHGPLHEGAVKRFARLGIRNITAIVGDGSKGWPESRQFDRIIVTAAARDVPAMLLDQLGLGGRMIIPIGSRLFRQRLVQFDRTEIGVARKELLAVRFVPLIGGRG